MCSVLIVALAMFGSAIAKPGYASHASHHASQHGYDVDYYVSFFFKCIFQAFVYTTKCLINNY